MLLTFAFWYPLDFKMVLDYLQSRIWEFLPRSICERAGNAWNKTVIRGNYTTNSQINANLQLA